MLKSLLSFLILLFVVATNAQETTGSIQGTLTDPDNNPLPFAKITITETETNFKYYALTEENGFYYVPNLTPSNHYSVFVKSLGYSDKTIAPVSVGLGNATTIDIQLKTTTKTLGTVTVGATREKDGNETAIGEDKINNTPTINRSIQDLTGNMPENNLNSFGGASNRFNNLSIDGIAANDVIGFQEPASGASGSAANGTPGSLSQSQPIGLGAVKQLSVKLAPFDASIGNFSGASINLVTKNGTNTFKNEVYAFGNNQFLIGKYANGERQEVANFYNAQFGFGSGGPIIKDKLFYYINFEQALSANPVLGAPGSANSNFDAAVVAQIADTLMSRYNYDPGTYTETTLKSSSTKLFARLDYKIGQNHKLVLRHNLVKSYADQLEWSASIFNFGNQGFRHNSLANSTALELKSQFRKRFSNNLKVGYNNVAENRDFEGRVFPHLQIATSSTNRIFAGTYREASVFNSAFNTIQLSDKLTYVNKNHTITIGGLVQYNAVDYGFLSAWNGRWEYKSVDDFFNNTPSRIRGVYNINNNDYDFVTSKPSASINVIEAALYAQDKIRINRKLFLTLGVRLDGQYFPEPLPISSKVLNTPEFSNFDNKISTQPQINPRLGFNYKLDEKGKYKLRGGSGLFSGRIPYLWFAYMEYISGTEYYNIDIKPGDEVPLTENLNDLTSQQPGITEINLLDKDFTIPREWKTNLALEINLEKDWKFTLEGTFTEVLTGIYFQSINRKDSIGQFSGADNRDYYLASGDAIKINPNFTNVFVLSNSDAGYRYNITAGVEKKIKGYSGYVGYTYGMSKDVSSTVRSSPAANYEWNQAIIGNNPDLSYSNFDLRHKIVSAQSYQQNWGNNNTVGISFLYRGRSGTPFSFIYQGDINRDGSSRNDLIYVPANQGEIQLVDITDNDGTVLVTADEQWNQLDNYIGNSEYLASRRGNYVERNGGRTPWNHELDMKLQYSKGLKNGNKLHVSLDVLNVLNLLNKNWGTLVYVPNVVNSSYSLLKYIGIEDNQPQYQFNIQDGETPWVTDLYNSRWRAQLGLRLEF